jgi:hexosaminidase
MAGEMVLQAAFHRKEGSMKKALVVIVLVSVSIFASQCYKPAVVSIPRPVAGPSIVPQPQKIEMLTGSFNLGPEVRLVVETDDPDAELAARTFGQRIKTAAGFDLTVSHGAADASSRAVVFKLSPGGTLGDEGYDLQIGVRNIVCSAATPRGLFYAVQTLFQLLPAEVYAAKPATGIRWTFPCLRITDSPRYAWRGMMLDCSRHFFPKSFILDFIDYLAMHKMNTFHWHLTDDQGWRVEIKRYPKLTEVGAWRVDREDKPSFREREPQKPGEKATYGGFYTQDDIREVVAYARSRFITIIPEIEMPGHCAAALAAYPELSCTGEQITVPPGSVWPPIFVYNPGKEETFEFLQNVLSEVADLFPGPYIHVGGDEVDKSAWKASAQCQALMAANGLKTEEELQSYFIRRIEKFLNSKNKRLIGWDEILQGGLAPNATVMSWRGTEGGIAAARQGHDVVMSPTSNCYFDYYQGSPDQEPLAIGGYLPLSKVYSFDPTPKDLTAEETAHILGAQANLWTEFIPSPRHAQYMLMPRMAAMAEIGWTAQARRDWGSFKERLAKQFERYDQAAINWAKSSYEVTLAAGLVPGKKEIKVRLDTESYRPEIRYTLDGQAPSASSTLYAAPIAIKKTTVVKAASFLNGQSLRGASEEKFFIHKALGRAVQLEFPYSEENPGGGPLALTDGLRGSKNQGDGRWQGFEGSDLAATIDLGRRTAVSRVSTGFLQNTGDSIFLPSAVEFLISEDGKDFQSAAVLANDVPPLSPGVLRKDFSANLKGVTARYIRIRAKNIGTCPPGHSSAGEKAWLLADEIIVD